MTKTVVQVSQQDPFEYCCNLVEVSILSCFVCLFFIFGFAAFPVIMDQDSSLHSSNHEEPSGLIGRQLLKMQNAVAITMLRIRQKVVQGFVVFFVVFLLLWISAFLYGSLYYSYMPNAAFSTSVHYYYRCVCEGPSRYTSKTQTNTVKLSPSSFVLFSRSH